MNKEQIKKIARNIMAKKISIKDLESLFERSTYYTTKRDNTPVVRDLNSDVFIFLQPPHLKLEDWNEANKDHKNNKGLVPKNLKDVEKAVKTMNGKGKLFLFEKNANYTKKKK